MEPHGCTAWWDGDQLTVWDSTQSVFDVRKQVAAHLGKTLVRRALSAAVGLTPGE